MDFKEWLKLNEDQDVISLSSPQAFRRINPNAARNIGNNIVNSIGSNISRELNQKTGGTGYYSSFSNPKGFDNEGNYYYRVTVPASTGNDTLRRKLAFEKALNDPSIKELISKEKINPRYANANLEFNNAENITYLIKFSNPKTYNNNVYGDF